MGKTLYLLSSGALRRKDNTLLFPTEKKRVEVVLTDELASELDSVYAGIEALVRKDAPPAAESCKYCRKCAYAEYCWG